MQPRSARHCPQQNPPLPVVAIKHTSHAAGLPPRPSSPKTREQVTRSPSYLKGTAGLVLSPARAEETTAGAGAAQLAPPGIACSPSSTTVMKSPPAPVRTGRPTKPKKQASGVPRTPTGGGGGTAGGHGLLPPPAIQREARSSFLKNGSGVGGGGGSTGGVRMARRPSALRHHSPVQQEQQEDGKFGLFVFGASRNRGDGSGGEAGAPCPQTPGTGAPQAPFTPGAEGRPEDFVGGDTGHLSETRGMALPATPTVTRDPRTPGFASTPGICSPPAPCHRGTGFGGGGGGGRRVGSRLRAGVDVDEGVGVCFAEGGPPPTAGGDDCGGCESRAAGGGDGEVGRGSGTIIISSRSSCCEEAGRCSGTGVDDVGGGGSLGCCRGGSRRRQSRGRSSETSYTEPPTREEQLLDASSAERFSEDLNEAKEWGGGSQQGIRRRSGRGARRSAEEREREGVSADDPRPLKNKQVVHTFASSGRSPPTASRRGPREHYWLN